MSLLVCLFVRDNHRDNQRNAGYIYRRVWNMKNTYVITGAGKGSGRVFAKTVANLGANIALVSRTELDLIHLKEELLQMNNRIKISIHAVDLTDPNRTKEAFNEIKATHGSSIKALVCFAGSWIKSKPISELEASDFLEGLQSNFFST